MILASFRFDNGNGDVSSTSCRSRCRGFLFKKNKSKKKRSHCIESAFYSLDVAVLTERQIQQVDVLNLTEERERAQGKTKTMQWFPRCRSRRQI